MKSSELRLIQLLNKNNSVQLDPDQVIFGSPRVSPDRRYNTWIPIYANEEEWRYGRPTTTAYNRPSTSMLGDDSVVEMRAYDRRTIINAVAKLLTDKYDIPTETSELLQRTIVTLKSGIVVVVYDLSNHPLIVGSMTCKVTIGRHDLDTVITNPNLDGFTKPDVGPWRVEDVIPTNMLTGFSYLDVN